MTNLLRAAAVLLAGAAQPALAASIIDSTSGFSTSGTAYLYNGAGFNYYPLNYSKSVTVGGITGSKYFGYYGAKATGTIKAKLGFGANVSFTNTVASALSGKVNTVAGGQGKAGSAFVLGTYFNDTRTASFIGTGQVDAAVTAAAYAGANVYAKACLVLCKDGTIVNLGIGKPKDFNILGYHSATNSVDFLDKTYTNQLPQYYTSTELPFTAKLEAVNVSGMTNGDVGSNSNHFHTEQQFAGAYVDMAKLVVQAFGLPNSVIQGSVLGFDYTTISAKAGVGINAIYDVTNTVLEKFVNYRFSTPVQIYDSIKQKWSGPLNTVTSRNADNGFVGQIRTVDPTVTSLSMIPTVVAYGQTDTTMKLNVTAQADVALLQVKGYGLSAGPLYATSGSIELGTLGKFSASDFFIYKDSTLAPLTLKFDGASGALAAADAGEDGGIAGLLQSFSRLQPSGQLGFVFIPDPRTGGGDTISGTIQKVFNYGTRGCNDLTVDACQFDRSFDPLATQQRTTLNAAGAPSFSYGIDFNTVDRIVERPEGAYGEQASPERMRALLESLPPPGSNGYRLDPPIADNSTPFAAAVPEPAQWSLMIAGFGLVGGVVRRRRQATVVAARSS